MKAGLFSAVVTTFTVDSYKTLQQDPGDASAQILARISLQLAALTPGQTAVNSTVPALSLATVTDAFSPGHVTVTVNILGIIFPSVSNRFTTSLTQVISHVYKISTTGK